MTYNTLIVDDFAPNPLSLRADVVAGEFKTQTGPDGAEYKNIQLQARPELLHSLAVAMRRAIVPRLCFFRLHLAAERPHTAVHADTICASWACVLYLNLPEQCEGGTAFWTHRSQRLDAMPDAAEIAALGREPGEFHAAMRKDWEELDHWTQTSVIGMKFNRCVLYPTKLFHSRWPLETFGKDASDGRLIWVCFFDLA